MNDETHPSFCVFNIPRPPTPKDTKTKPRILFNYRILKRLEHQNEPNHQQNNAQYIYILLCGQKILIIWTHTKPNQNQEEKMSINGV